MSLIGHKLGTRPAADKPRGMRISRRREARERLKGTSASREIGKNVRFRDQLGNEYSIERNNERGMRLRVRPQRPLRERRRYMRSIQAAQQLRVAMRRALSIRRGDTLRFLDIAEQRVVWATVIDCARSPVTGQGVVTITSPTIIGDVLEPELFAVEMLL